MGERRETINAFSARALTIGGVTTIEEGWPLGELWAAIKLRFNIALTIGTGSGALSEALQRIIQNITFLTDKDGMMINCPARPLWRRAQIIHNGSPPVADAFSAATGTYRIDIPIVFADPRSKRPFDTILNTKRYKKVTLQISMGNVDRLLSTVGTSSVTATVDVDIDKYPGEPEPGSLPIYYPYLVSRQPVNPNSQLYVDLELGGDLAYKRLLVFTSDGSDSSANAGDSFQGIGQNNILNLVSLEDQNGYAGLRQVIDDTIQRRNVLDYGIDGGAIMTGMYWHDFTKEGSINEAEYTGLKSRFQLTFTTDTLVASSRVHLFSDAVRSLKKMEG